MTHITEQFGTLYHPVKAIVIYQSNGAGESQYVEAYDMDEAGYPINAHPLTVRESTKLAKALDTSAELSRNYLAPEGLLPKNVLHTNTSKGFALWFTPAMHTELLFTDTLDIPCGKAAIPPLLWKATKEELYVFALAGTEMLTKDTPLYQAPFFNIYHDGRVCMGTVAVNIRGEMHLEAFIRQWQQYFFNSYFSHLLGNASPVKDNIVQLWQRLVNTHKKFPIKQLKPHSLTMKDLL